MLEVNINNVDQKAELLTGLKKEISSRWPEVLRSASDCEKLVFCTGFPELDALFPLSGIPYGQMIEITGGVSSGKTSLLLRMLAGWMVNKTVCYVDFNNSFFPDAAISSGVSLENLLVIRPVSHSPDSLQSCIRTAELLLQKRKVDIIVLDLVGQQTMLPIGLLHRLRLKTVRGRALTVFLTQDNSRIIPASMASLRLEVKRSDRDRLEVLVVKSRISVESVRVEVQP